MVTIRGMAVPRRIAAGTPTVAAILTGSALVVGLVVLAERFGVPPGVLIAGTLGVSILGYALIALWAHSAFIADHLVAGRSIRPLGNGCAIAAVWLSGFVCLGLPGLLAAEPAAALLPAAWCIGLGLVSALVAPYVHKSGALTLPDFLGLRYRGVMPRLLGMALVTLVTLGLLIAQMQAVGLLFEWTLAPRLPAFGYHVGVWVAAAGVVICAFPGGMYSATWTQGAQAVAAALGLMVPVGWLAVETLPDLPAEGGLDAAAAALAARVPELGSTPTIAEAAAILATVALGTAAMPHLLGRTLTTATVRGARASLGWAILALVVLLATVPMTAVLADLAMGALFDLGGGSRPHGTIPGWLLAGPEGAVTICGAPAADPVLVRGACGEAGAEGYAAADVAISAPAVALVSTGLAAMPATVTALIAAGILAAALSTGSALGVTLANTVSHDLADRLLEAEMRPAQKISIGRGALFALVGLAAALAVEPPAPLWDLLGWTVSLAASGLFAALVLGIWDRRTTGPGAAAGMVAGFGVALLCIGVGAYGPDGLRATGDEAAWLGLDPRAAAVFGVPAALAITWLVSRMTPPPPDATQDFIDEMRIPRGSAITPGR